MKEAMKKGLLCLVTGSALAASPMAFAAQDTSGMQYTSAAEGFYASIRVRYQSGGTEDDGANIRNSTSRIGVRGTNDLGGGLSGFYQYEMYVPIDNQNKENDGEADDLATRLAHVGLRGNFGELVAGTFWDQTYNWTHGSTDVANASGGNLIYSQSLPGRISESVQYTTPDLNGFQAALRFSMDKETDAGGTEVTPTNEDDNNLDQWALSARYAVQGFDVASSYILSPDGHGDDDRSAYVMKAGYAQDNWYVNMWYSQENMSDSAATAEDQERLSLASGVSVDKVNIYALYEATENVGGEDGVEDAFATVGVQYNLGSRSRVWVEYAAQDQDSDPTKEDFVTIGMQHDF